MVICTLCSHTYYNTDHETLHFFILVGVRPSLGSGPELPFMPNMLPFGGPFPGPDGMPMARPPFPLPHMVPPFTGPMEGNDEKFVSCYIHT